MAKQRIGLLLALWLGVFVNPAEAAPAAIATAYPLATEAGFEILSRGGNAFDAAVAVSAALAVVEPSSSGIGGGGFWLLHRASDNFSTMVDGRERAPLSARVDMYLDATGEPIPKLSIDGPLSAGIPGLPAGLVHLTETYGNLPLATSLAPAIRLARDGFVVDEHYLKMVGYRLDALRASSAAAAIFLDRGDAPASGFRLVQGDLAKTLEALAEQGRDGFYTGLVAQQLIAGVNAAGGHWRTQDLTAYRVKQRTPVTGQYRQMKITTAPPPSSGGVALITALNILERYALDEVDDITRKHLVVEAMRRAYRDRAQYLGDPDFTQVPVAQLIDKTYAAGLAAGIRRDRATPSAMLPGRAKLQRGRDTTHFSIIDGDGNRVAATLSVNLPFGSGFVPPGTGVLLNDEMDDFSSKPGLPNAYGLVGAEANAIAPGKRPLSSMTPTFLEIGDDVAVLGTPGGSRIITMVLLAALEFGEGNKDPASWVSLPRYHHQFLPDVIQFETDGLSSAQQDGLSALGHQLKPVGRRYGNMQAIWWDRASGHIRAASDPRRQGLADVR
ncbi:MAG: gamma-glutamyltransferase [Gammaproteobacteria bacterium]|nr:gamma-glutamyltransferase [Gammaproteobacteria bacterium]